MRGDQQQASGDARRTPTRRKRSRAQAMVEFALVAPLFFTLLFGIVEFSLIYTSINIVDFATKDAARLGSLLGRTDATVDSQMIAEIRTRTAGIIVAKVIKIEVFKADATGKAVIVSGNPVEYVYDVNGNNIGTTSWPVSQRNDTLLDADYLGLKVTYNYTYLTGFIAGAGSTLQLTSTSVQRIEPQDYQGNYVAPNTPAATASLAFGNGARFTSGSSVYLITTPLWIQRRETEGEL